MLTVTDEMDPQAPAASEEPPAPIAVAGRMVGLDGIRALAVVAVVVYHFSPSWLPGGFFGVDIFFVISGFLITGIVVHQWEQAGHIDLVGFWWRRARRLLPAVVTLLVVVVLVSAVCAPDALSRLRTDVPAALFYVTNWWFVFHKVSYFQASGRPSLVLHLWSLAIEEQFYVLWPLALTLLLPRVKRPGRIAVGTAVAALGSTALMAVLFQPNGTDPSRVYFGTDTHAQGLLIGCTLALALPYARLALLRSRSWQIGFNILGAVGVGALGWLVFNLNDYQSATYRGGFLLVDLAAVALVIAATSPASLWSSALARQPMRWVGTRSYAIYLWHWPVQQLMRARTDMPFGGFGLFVVQVALILTAAELSYRLVEEPIRSGRARVWLAARYERSRWREAWIVGPGVFLIVLTMVTMNAPAPKPTGLLAQGSTAASRLKLTSKVSSPTSPRSVPPAPPGPPLPLSDYEPVLAIGDSVMLGCSGALQNRFGAQLTVDAAVDRHVDQGIDRLRAYKGSGRLPHYRTLVIGLGTNGPMTTAMFDQIAALAAGIPNIIFITTYDDRSWVSSTNSVLTQGVASHPGTKLFDWYSVANSNPSLLGPDDIHPRLAGIETYANLLLATLDPPTAPVAKSPATQAGRTGTRSRSAPLGRDSAPAAAGP
ncbi:MAG: acyltransferase [Actinomycetota bacterium]|nr:acyltransferase [Actinomycetota bacterium]